MSAVPIVLSTSRRGMPPQHLADLDNESLQSAVADLGLPKFRADQIKRHYYGRLESDPMTMTDLPANMREQVSPVLFPPLLEPVRDINCDGGLTQKTLWRAWDGTLLESVLMRYSDRATLCISSQAGCGMACPFCATGQAGLTRNLSTAEIIEQVRVAAKTLRDGKMKGGEGRLSNIVFMGMGEPLANYKRVLMAVRRITNPEPDGFGLSQRHVTVSTVGLAPAIKRLADEDLQVTLAISLHAPDNELRNELIPANNRWPIEEVLDAAKYFADKTGRRISIEYALIRDMNDQVWRGKLLGKRLRGALGPLVHVNAIPLNPTPGSKWDASPKAQEQAFVQAVRDQGVSCTVRDTRGQDIAAACGQLAAEESLGA